MINALPWESRDYDIIIDEDLQPKIGEIKWVTNIPRENQLVVSLVDNFEYPLLAELRSQFEATGSYTSEQLDEIIGVYGRLPKYRAQSHSTT